MRQIVLDPSGFLTWFGPDASGRTWRTDYESGLLEVHVPRGFALDVIDAAAHDGGWPRERIAALAVELERLGFITADPPPFELAGWVARGLDAPRAAYAALAESLDLAVVSADPVLLARAAPVARPIEG